jgi:hypothetical protein
MLEAGIDEMRSVYNVAASPSGQWLFMVGQSNRLLPVSQDYLYNYARGELVTIDAVLPWWYWKQGIHFSPNGRWVGWLEAVGGGDGQVTIADLGSTPVEITRTRLFLDDFPDRAALSDSGRRLSVLDQYPSDVHTVYELPSGRMLSSWRVPEEYHSSRPVFLPDDTLRFYLAATEGSDENPRAELRVFELGVGDSRPAEKASIPVRSSPQRVEIDRSGGRTLVSSWRDEDNPGEWSIVDNDTSEILLELGRDSQDVDALMLADGRIAILKSLETRIELAVLSGNGETEQVVDIGPGKYAGLGYETAPGRVVVEVFRNRPFYDLRGSRTVEVDLASGTTREIGRELWAISPYSYQANVVFSPEPGSIMTRCFRGSDGELMIWDPAAGELEQITARAREFETVPSWSDGSNWTFENLMRLHEGWR